MENCRRTVGSIWKTYDLYVKKMEHYWKQCPHQIVSQQVHVSVHVLYWWKRNIKSNLWSSMYICGICMYISVVLCVCHTSLHLQSFGLCVKGGKCMWGIIDMWVVWQLLAKCRVLMKSVAKWFPAALSRSLFPVRCSYVYITDITVYHIIYVILSNSPLSLSLSLPPSSSPRSWILAVHSWRPLPNSATITDYHATGLPDLPA